jgi:deoxyribodipyrimidine photo-lyase
MNAAPIVFWFRRDLRLTDNPALAAALDAAAKAGTSVLPVFILDPRLTKPSGSNRLAYLYACLQSLRESGLTLTVLAGDPSDVLNSLCAQTKSTQVYCAEDFGPYGRRRDETVAETLARVNVTLSRVDSPYIVAPGTVRKGDGTPFKVFTPFSRVWLNEAHGAVAGPSIDATSIEWFVGPISVPIPTLKTTASLPQAGEAAAKQRIAAFVETNLRAYEEQRNDPAKDATSRLSADLKYGVIHPRQLLASIDANPGEGSRVFRSELCWREFYADVMWHRPETAREAFNVAMQQLPYDGDTSAQALFEAWCSGKTGYPFIDAGMRQLLSEGWMHNRVRMAVASFLVKDLHIDWRWGARWFMNHLIDGDLASNQHGWQWTAGTGTDASPYFRIFNPISQGKKFDPTGAYVRRYIPELHGVGDKFIHEPWLDPSRSNQTLFDDAGASKQGNSKGAYPPPIVDHGTERLESLRRYKALRSEP